MYKEMDESGQMVMDCRLSSERSLEENTNLMIDFAHEILVKSEPSKVRNRHEGYGLLAEDMCRLNGMMKVVTNGMKDLLLSLDSDDVTAMDKVGSVSNALADTIVAAVSMAAESKRIQDDLYDMNGAWGTQPTPLEKYMDNDGFEEPEQEDDEDGEDAVQDSEA